MPQIRTSDSAGVKIDQPVQLLEPSKMQQDGIRRILKHWKRRQNEGLVPFMFSHILRAGVMVPALPLDVPAQNLRPLIIRDGEDDDMNNDESDLPSATPTDIAAESTRPPVSHHYPSPAPTSSSNNDRLPSPSQTELPRSRSPSPDVSNTKTVGPPTSDVEATVSPDDLDISCIDPMIPQLTRAQLLVTGPEAFTTNALSGARISPSAEALLTAVTGQVSLGQPGTGGVIQSALAPLAPVAETPVSSLPVNASIEIPTTTALPPTRKRGRPRKNLGGIEQAGNESPGKKRARKTDTSASTTVASSGGTSSAPNGVPHVARPTPRPIRKKPAEQIDLTNVQPYEGLITRRMASGKTKKLIKVGDQESSAAELSR